MISRGALGRIQARGIGPTAGLGHTVIKKPSEWRLWLPLESPAWVCATVGQACISTIFKGWGPSPQRALAGISTILLKIQQG